MKNHELNEAELAFYDDVLARNANRLNKKKGVIGVGLGYKISKGKLTDTVCITAIVPKKKKRVKSQDRVDGEIEGVPTDIMEVGDPDKKDPFEEQLLGGLAWEERGAEFPVVRGGIEIHNRNLCRVNAAALACVVYDKSNGKPLGLTCQHGIAYVHKPNSRHRDIDTGCPCDYCNALRKQHKTTGYLRTAEIGDPINQPTGFNVKSGIGKLFKKNDKLDLALIKLEGREFEPKVEGISGDLNNPIIAYPGMAVECSSRHTHTLGTVIYRGSYNNYPGRTILKIQFDAKYKATRNGDSGGLWVQRVTRRPVGIHTAKKRGKPIAIATCLSQLNQLHSVTFQTPKFRDMVKSLKPYHTSFVKLSDGGFYVFCNRIGDVSRTKPLKLVKYDNDYKGSRDSWHRIRPVASGVAAASFKNKVYCAWRSANSNKIETAKLKDDLTFGTPKSHALKTRYKPALCALKDQFFLFYTDANTETLDIAISSNGKAFTAYDMDSANACSAPAAANFGNHVIVAWVDKMSKQIFMKKVTLKNNKVYLENYPRITRYYQAMGDPALVAGKEVGRNGKEVEWLYLAFTTPGGGLQILRRTHKASWNPVPNTASISNYSPTLFHHHQRVIWSRQS